MLSFIQVLMLTTALLDVLVAGLVYMVFRRESDQSARLWVLGSVLMAAGMFMLVTRAQLPDFLAFAVTNFIMLYAMVLYRDSFWSLVKPGLKLSPIPLALCVADGLLIGWLKMAGFLAYLSFTAAIAWSLMHFWMLYSFNQLRREMRNAYFTVFMAITGVGLLVWMLRVSLTAGFNISLATDPTLINLLSLTGAHLVLMAQQIVYLVVRLTDEKSKKQKIQELNESVELMWRDQQTVIEARQREREDLLRDVHDGFGSKLAATQALVERGRLDSSQVAEHLREIMADLHLVVDTLRHSETTLEDALVDMRYRMQRRANAMPVAIHWQIELQGLPVQSSRTILHQLRVVQEALNNALRHARALNIWISARYVVEQQQLQLSVRDDGCGLPENPGLGQGINNMRHRTREIGGELQLQALNPGSEIALTIPVPPHEHVVHPVLRRS